MRSSPVQCGGVFELLESRTLFSVPAHLALAERSVAEVLPQNNVYSNGASSVTWAGINGADTTTNTSDCTTYVTRLLKAAYGYTDAQFTSWFGVSSPSLTKYYDSATADSALDGFKAISALQPGDLFICKYPTGASALGHMVIADGAPVYVKTTSTMIAYNLTVIDVTGSTHTNDTRAVIDPTTGVHDTGVGRGTIRIYTDLSGNLSYWAWGTSSTATTYDPATYPCTFAHVMGDAYLNTPVPATNLSAVVSGVSTVGLSWTDNATNETSYVLQQSMDNGSYATLAALPADTTSYAIASGTPGHTYSYRLQAVNGTYGSPYATTSVTINSNLVHNRPVPLSGIPTMPTATQSITQQLLVAKVL